MDSPAYTIEETLSSWHDGVKFYVKRWIPQGSSPPRVLLIVLHGFAERIGRYDHVWPLFAKRNIEVMGYDLRGFGRSGPTHGDATLIENLTDLQYIIKEERSRLDERGLQNVPVFLYGHSMGAGAILSLLTRSEDGGGASDWTKDKVEGVICAAPWILRSKPPSATILWLAPWLLWLCPNMAFYKTINPTGLTSDPIAQESYHQDPLHNGNVYLKTVIDPLLAGYQILDKDYQNWPTYIPILITHGDIDRSTSPRASRSFVDKIEAVDKEFKLWPEMLHEGHNERPDIRDPFLEYSIKLEWHEEDY